MFFFFLLSRHKARDACVKTIVEHCPYLVNLVLANCPLITDESMSVIATNLTTVRLEKAYETRDSRPNVACVIESDGIDWNLFSIEILTVHFAYKC